MTDQDHPHISTLMKDLEKRPVRESFDVIRETINENISLPVDTNTIQVVGSNGKGSFIHYFSELLRMNEQTTVEYTSPHLIQPGDRIKINGEALSKAELNRLLSEIDESIRSSLSPFELLFFVTLRVAEQEKPDYLLLEAGMGGRWDATSAIEADATVLTNVELEHTQFLGDTLEEIVREQTNQIPDETLLISAPIKNSISETLTKIVQNKNLQHHKSKISNPADERARDLAKLASKTLLDDGSRKLKTNISQTKRPPGRLETFERNDLTHVLDVAHTPNAIRNFLEYLSSFNSTAPWGIVYGSLKGKKHQDIINLFQSTELPLQLVFVRPPGPRSLDPDRLQDFWDGTETPPIFESPTDGYQHLLDRASNLDGLAIVGSLKLIGFFKESWK